MGLPPGAGGVRFSHPGRVGGFCLDRIPGTETSTGFSRPGRARGTQHKNQHRVFLQKAQDSLCFPQENPVLVFVLGTNFWLLSLLPPGLPTGPWYPAQKPPQGFRGTHHKISCVRHGAVPGLWPQNFCGVRLEILWWFCAREQLPGAKQTSHYRRT